MKHVMMTLAVALGCMLTLSAGTLGFKNLNSSRNMSEKDGVLINTPKKHTHAYVVFKLREAYAPDKVLTFEYRLKNSAKAPCYLRAAFSAKGIKDQKTWNGFPAPKEGWNKVSLPFSELSFSGKPCDDTMLFDQLDIYSFIKERTDWTLELRNVKIEVPAKK